MCLKFADVAIPVDKAKQSNLSFYTGLLASAPSLVTWMMRHKFEPTNKTCMDFLRDLRVATPPNVKIGIAGFCWGGRYAVRAGKDEYKVDVAGSKRHLVDAIVALHPSNLDLPADVEEVGVPLSFAWGFEDTNTKIELKGKVEAIHERENKGGRKVPDVDHKVYKPGRHGFAVRGNPDDPQEKACLVDSEKQVLEWFGRYL